MLVLHTIASSLFFMSPPSVIVLPIPLFGFNMFLPVFFFLLISMGFLPVRSMD